MRARCTLLIISWAAVCECYEVIYNIPPEKCNDRSFFDSTAHECRECKDFQTTSEDRSGCSCASGFSAEFNDKSKAIECVPCGEHSPSATCLLGNLRCGPYDIKVLNTMGNTTSAQCVQCPYWHQPDGGRAACVPCSTVCHCPADYEDVNGTCVRNTDSIPDSPALYTVSYQGRYYASNYLRDWVKPTASKCKALGGGRVCEQLSNLCVLMDYNFDSMSACSFHRQIATSNGLRSLYYDEGSNYQLLNNERIRIRGDQRIDFFVKEYALDGTYHSMQTLQSVFTSICCTDSWMYGYRNANSRETFRCALTFKNFKKEDMRFYEIYLVDRAVNQSRLINVPLRVMNFARGGVERNKENDVSRWQLTKRFFNVDVVTGTNQEGVTEFIRFLSSLTIRLSVLRSEQPLSMRVPFATVSYDMVGNMNPQNMPTVRFVVENSVNMEEAIRAVEVSLSVLSSFALLYTCVRIVVWYHRSDKGTIDLMTLIRLLVYGADILANVIFVVVFFATFYWFLTYRQQDEVTISLPDVRDEQFIKDLVISAFTLKAASVLWMIFEQCSVDIFLIDWENPKPGKGEVVSVWRMYFCANEWNELQVTRKSSMALQVILVLSILCVFDLERYALEIPSTYYKSPSALNYNTVMRLALGAVVYLLTSSAQNIVNAVIVERYVDHKIQRFTDLCTLANISVWLLIHPRYGFYIHGRSPHGFADTDMTTMCQQLQKEEENLCAHRGLIQGQDIQTFSISLHPKFKEKWSKLQTRPAIEQVPPVPPFHVLNKFLGSFLDHALNELDFEVRDRNFVETVLDLEWRPSMPEGRTIFYNDRKNCFDSVLFYGNEGTLVMFDVLLFSLVDMYCHDYLVAMLTTYIISKVLQVVRYRLGRRNLAKKTMIDSRFLF